MSAPRSNRWYGDSLASRLTQLQLREPQVPHLYRGGRFVLSWQRDIRDEGSSVVSVGSGDWLSRISGRVMALSSVRGGGRLLTLVLGQFLGRVVCPRDDAVVLFEALLRDLLRPGGLPGGRPHMIHDAGALVKIPT